MGGIGSGAKESIRWAAAPRSHLAAHSRSRLVHKKKTLFLADGLFFSLDRCLLMGDPRIEEMEGLLVEKEIFTKEEFLEMVRVVNQEMKRK